MTDAREQLASLVLEAIRADVDAYVRPLPDDEYYSEDLSSAIIDSIGIDLRAVADAILAAGWRPVGDLKQKVGNLLEADRAYEWMEERFTDGRVAALEDVLELLEGPHTTT